jgi:pseudomonalisin
MRLASPVSCRVLLAVAFGLFAAPGLTLPIHGQVSLKTPVQRDRIPAHANLSSQAILKGHVPAWVGSENLSPLRVDLLTTMHVSFILQRDPNVQAAFEQLLADQQNPASPLYHHWLIPQQIGQMYGPTQADVSAITSWVTAQGLTVDDTSPSRMVLHVTGPVSKFGSAFQTSFSYYGRQGREHLALNKEPSMPAAFAGVLRYIDGLDDLQPEPAAYGGVGHLEQSSAAVGENLRPFYTASNGTHLITPNDFSVLYDIGSVYAGGNTGATIGGNAQHIAVIDRSDVAATDISEWAAKVGVTNYKSNTILATGTDPGQTGNGDQLESTLDVNRTLSTAPGAVTDLVVAPNSTGGIMAAASYNVNTLLDPVMSISFYGCEAVHTAANTAAWDTLFQTAAAEGISTFVCAGDSGAAGCASDFAVAPTITPVRSVNYICSSSYDTCVGGTEFNDATNASLYWSSTNSSGLSSVLSYIPEGAWNEPANVSNGVISYDVQAGGGGVSQYIAKPTWQTGVGVPADGFRDQPDVSFSSAVHDAYYSCLAYSGGNCANGYYEYLAGTSAAAPAMASITALLNTKAGAAQGNLNPLLYRLAQTAPSAFHDVTVATSGVSNCSVSVASVCNNSTPSSTALTGGLSGYAVTAGYDQATGLGSLDVAKFITAATTQFSVAASTPSLSFISGATSGNTDAIVITSVNGFAGSVSLSCSVSTSTAVYQPSCAISPGSVTLTAAGNANAVVTISSTTATASTPISMQHNSIYPATLGGGAILALLMAFAPRRRSWPSLALMVLAMSSVATLMGCSGNSGTTISTPVPKSSAGNYTVTVTGSSSSATASSTFAVTIN